LGKRWERRERRGFACTGWYWFVFAFLAVVVGIGVSGSLSLSLPLSRLTQSTIGSETATEWMEFGLVRARVVARVPPIREPSREI
jgi:hypothetical protein